MIDLSCKGKKCWADLFGSVCFKCAGTISYNEEQADQNLSVSQSEFQKVSDKIRKMQAKGRPEQAERWNIHVLPTQQ